MYAQLLQAVSGCDAVAYVLALMAVFSTAQAKTTHEKDTLQTTAGPLEITFVGHGSLVLAWGGKTIHVDPYGRLADYSALPKADLILITHHHGDHLDTKAIDMVRTDATQIILTGAAADQLGTGTVMKNGDVRTLMGAEIEVVPAYNIVHKRPDGNPFHPRGEGNGYVLTFGQTRVYIAGDTEGTAEMKALKNIDVAFLPMNLPYTMTPEEVAAAAKAFRPKVLYPYHYGETDPQAIVGILKGEKGIEVRIRAMR